MMKILFFAFCFTALNLLAPAYALQGSYCISRTPLTNPVLFWEDKLFSSLTDSDGWVWHDKSADKELSYFESPTGSVVYMPKLYESPCGYYSAYLGSGCPYAKPFFNKTLKMTFITGYEFGFGAPENKKLLAVSPKNQVEFETQGPNLLKYSSDIITSGGVALENESGNLVYFNGKAVTPFSITGLTKDKDGRSTWSIFNDPNSKRSFVRSTEASKTPFLYEVHSDLKVNKIPLPDNIANNFFILSSPNIKQTWILNPDGIYAEMYGSFERVMHLPNKYTIDTTKNIGFDAKNNIYFTILESKSTIARPYSLKEQSYDACLLKVEFRQDSLFEEIH